MLFIEVRKNGLLSASQDIHTYIHTLRGRNGEMLISKMVEKLLVSVP